ncbi:MAG: hypothetical protein V7641_4997 [Blastocatellia bacterium]
MKTVRRIYERMPDTISVPPELRSRRAEVIILPLDEVADADVPESNAANGQAESEIADPLITQFFGSLPDFPEREAQGEYEIREELL